MLDNRLHHLALHLGSLASHKGKRDVLRACVDMPVEIRSQFRMHQKLFKFIKIFEMIHCADNRVVSGLLDNDIKVKQQGERICI